MTPAVRALQKARVAHTLHPYAHDPASRSYGLEAAGKIGVPPALVYKTLIVRCQPGELAVAVVPVSCQLDLKRFAAVRGAKKASMAATADVERATGYVPGGVSPLGQKRRLPVVVDRSINDHERIYISAGKRGLDVSLRPADLIRLADADVGEIASVKT
jgi:Cys-tRNA(Pro)/Cys-tRNA(Cys) deacylase